MNSGVLTSEIENIELDIESLAKKFSIYQVSYKGLDKEQRSAQKKQIPSEIYRSSSVLSLIDARGSIASYYVLLNKQDHFNFQHEELSIKRAKMADMLEVFVARLLLAALPRLINEDGSEKLKRFEADGVNYLVDYKNIGGSRTTKKMLITVGVDITPDWGFKNEYGYPRQNLSVGVQSFTPIEQKSKADGEVYKSYQSKQRYCLDEWTQIISKNVSGDYIKAAFDGSKNRVKAIDFTNEELETFELSRIGVLGQCLNDIENVYSGALRIDLKRLGNDYHEFVTDTQVKKAYTQIWEAMRQFPVNIVDFTGDKVALSLLKNALEHDGFVFSESGNAIDGQSNILLLYPPEVYQAKDADDPYKTVKKANPEIVIQACFPESLINHRKGTLVKPVYEVLIKELLIKHEVNQRIVLLPDKDIPENVEFIYPVATGVGKKKVWNFHRLVSKGGRLHFNTLSTETLDDLLLTIEERDQVYISGNDWGGGGRYPFVYWPETEDYLFFVESDTVALPEFSDMLKILSNIQEARSKPVERELLNIFAEDYPSNQATPAIQTLLTANPDDAVFHYVDINAELKKIFKRRHQDKDVFYQWIEEEVGLQWKRSLKRKQDGFLNANLGLFINRQENAYYVGAKGSLQQSVTNFSKIYRFVSSLPSLPDEILPLFKTLHIRHKQLTVLPYPFKHVREYAESEKRKSRG